MNRFVLCARTVVLPFAVAIALVANGAEKHSYIADRTDGVIWDTDFYKNLKEQLGGRYKDLQIVISSCFSGGFATEASALGGNWSVAAARDTKAKHSMLFSSEKEITDPQGGNAKEGLKVAFTQSMKYFHGWLPEWIRKLQSDSGATAQQLFDFAVENDYQRFQRRPREPEIKSAFASGGTGAEAKINSGEKNYAIVWSAEGAKFDFNLLPQLIVGLEGAGYTDKTIDFAFERDGGGKIGSPPTQRFVNRHATVENYYKMVLDLRGKINAEAKDKAFIFLYGHGNYEERNDERRGDAIPGLPMQGREFRSGDSALIDVAPEFYDSFFEETGVDDERFTRFGSARLSLSTISENFAGPVNVLFDGIDIGSISLGNHSGGADYQLLLTDSVMHQLFAGNVLDDQKALLQFQFPSGNPNNFYQTATRWDFELSSTLKHYGIGIAGPPLFIVPEPATIVLFTAALAAILTLCSDNRTK